MTTNGPGNEAAVAAAPRVDDTDTRTGWRAFLVQGNLGSLRVVVILAFIWTYFSFANPAFLSSNNLTNLTLQIAAVGVVSIGIVLILLLAEIDISVGSVSGLCAAITGVLSAQHGWSAWPAILAGVAVGATIGLLQGTIVTWLRIPSFVVTLAGLLGWAGVQLAVIGAAGTVSITDEQITRLANSFLPDALSWALAVVAVLWLVASALWNRSRRRAAGVASDTILAVLIRPVIIAVIVVGALVVMTRDRGIPLSVAILVFLVIVFDAIITGTRYGRHVMAVGGNEEAARRSGIRVARVKIVVFALGGALAAFGGVLAMSRLLSVDAGQGSGNFLLYAIAGPVIAGVSLFGGRGSVWGALLGAIVIGSIQNGMNLLNYQASTQAIVTALVLLAAVIIDALSRNRRARSRA